MIWSEDPNIISSWAITSTVHVQALSISDYCKSCIRDFWFQTINTLSEKFQFRCPSLEMLFRCLDRITKLLGLHQTPSALGNTQTPEGQWSFQSLPCGKKKYCTSTASVLSKGKSAYITNSWQSLPSYKQIPWVQRCILLCLYMCMRKMEVEKAQV